MQVGNFIKRIKPWMLPIAMIVGVVAHDYIGYLKFLSPYLIFIMLLITYCRISFNDLRLNASMGWLLGIQIVGALALYFVLRYFNVGLAQSIFICVYCPTATAAPVVTGMLGGKVERVAAFSLLSNVVVAITGPALLAYIGDNQELTFWQSLATIAVNVLPLIIGPLIVAMALQFTIPKAHKIISTHQGLSFYIWALALLIVVGNSVSYIMKEISEDPTCVPMIVLIAVLSLAVCLLQFYFGNRIGHRYGDPISSAQSLGQKNTVLAVWLALTYLKPIATVGPACYIAWHNIVNSYQIYRRAHEGKL
jgi:BASS family bile acid:Na+ symporter